MLHYVYNKVCARGKVINAYINVQHQNEWKEKKKKKGNFNVLLSV